MKILSTSFFCLIVFLFSSNISFAQQNKAKEKPTKVTIEKDTSGKFLKKSEKLQMLLDAAVRETLADFAAKTVKPEEVAATIIDLSGDKGFQSADYNGEMKIYPASVVKMFYLVAAHRQAQDGKIKFTPEFERGLKDMIEVSSNDATQYVLDVLTDTASGGELPEKQFTEWSYKRNAVNRYYESLGYKNINVNQKTYCEDAYGREQQFRKFRGENRNMLTTNATARLLAEIAARKAVNSERSAQMLELLKRDPFAPTNDKEDQAHGFTGISLVELGMKDAKLYSKAGYTSSTRHDAAYIETPEGMKLVIVIFTQNHADERGVISGIATRVLKGLQKEAK